MKRSVVKIYGFLPSVLRVRLVRHLTPNYTGGVVTMLVKGGGDVLFLRSTYRKGWGLPGGLLDRHELPEDTAQREVGEELGLHIDRPSVYRTSVNARQHMVTWFTIAFVTDEQVASLSVDPIEIAEIKWFHVSNMPELDGEIAPLEIEDRLAVENLVKQHQTS